MPMPGTVGIGQKLAAALDVETYEHYSVADARKLVHRMLKILLIQGPNMSYLGRRQPEIYGKTTAAELNAMLRAHARANKYKLALFYTHSESDAIERLYRAVDEGIDGLVMNPAAFLFAGYALRDCLRAVPFPYIEVHMTNIEKRGLRSILAETALGCIAGFGIQSYFLGLDAMLRYLRDSGRE